MKWGDINEVAKSVLLRLHDQLEEPIHDLTVEQVNSFKEPFSPVQIRTALSLLCQRGFATTRKVRGETRYGITRSGIREVETHYLVTDDPSGRSYMAKGKPWALVAKRDRAGTDWTMWGTILTGIGILVAIALAFVA